MELTEREAKALTRLRKREKHWRWFRFIALAIGLGIVAVGLWLIRETQQNLLNTTRHMSSRESPSGMEVYFASLFGGQAAVADLIPILGAWIVGFTVGRWRGDPVHTLVIGAVERDIASPPGPGA